MYALFERFWKFVSQSYERNTIFRVRERIIIRDALFERVEGFWKFVSQSYERIFRMRGWKFFSCWRERGGGSARSLSPRNPISRETRPDFSNFRYGTSAIWRKIPRRWRKKE